MQMGQCRPYGWHGFIRDLETKRFQLWVSCSAIEMRHMTGVSVASSNSARLDTNLPQVPAPDVLLGQGTNTAISRRGV